MKTHNKKKKKRNFQHPNPTAIMTHFPYYSIDLAVRQSSTAAQSFLLKQPRILRSHRVSGSDLLGSTAHPNALHALMCACGERSAGIAHATKKTGAGAAEADPILNDGPPQVASLRWRDHGYRKTTLAAQLQPRKRPVSQEGRAVAFDARVG